MSIESRLSALERQMKSLQTAYLQSQENEIPLRNKVDDTSNKVEQITPYKASKTAYIGDTEVVFENVPQGDILVFGLEEYQVKFITNETFVITFDALEEVTTVSISIQ